MNRFIIVGACVVLLASCSGGAVSAADVLGEVVDVYESCNAYCDEGRVVSTSVGPRGRRVSVDTFETCFVRGAVFRFQFRGGNGFHYSIDAGPESVQTRMHDGELLQERGLKDAVARLTGVTNRSSILVPSLLMPDFGVFRVTGIDVQSIQDTEGVIEVEGVANGVLYALEVNPHSMAIQRIVIEKKVGDQNIVREITLSPILNAPGCCDGAADGEGI